MALYPKKYIKRTLLRAFAIDTGDIDYRENSLRLSFSHLLANTQSISDTTSYFDFTDAVVEKNLEKFLACTRTALNETCLKNTIVRVGKLLFRRSLTPAEIIKFQSLALAQGNSYIEVGTKLTLVAMLNSPNFLYQRFYGSNGSLTQLELASKIAFFILGSNPDEALVDAAEANRLGTPAEILQQVQRLSDNQDVMKYLFQNFISEFWKLDQLDETVAASLSPDELNRLSPHLKEEFRRTSEDIYQTQNGDWRRIFDFKKTYVNKALADHYAFNAPDAVNDSTWVPVTLPNERSGLLPSGLVMAAHSGTKYTSATHRGLFVINKLLCRSISPPPPNIDELATQAGLNFPDSDTVRERTDKLTSTRPCSSCHVQFDPYGLIFSNFDSFGRYYTTRFDQPVDSRVSIDNQSLQTIPELAGLILKNENELSNCLLYNLYSYALGIPLDKTLNLIGGLGIKSEERFRFSTVVRAIVLNKNFQNVKSN